MTEQGIREADLLNLARRLDTRGLAQIYDAYSSKLYRYASKFLNDPRAAEDCVSETFSRFLQALQAGRGPRDHLQAYLFRVAHNLIVDSYRSPVAEDSLKDDLPDSNAGVEEAASLSLSQQRVRAAIHHLTPEQQQVIVLKFLEGWENAEIAHVLNKPVGAVKSLQRRALDRLQAVLLVDEV